MKMNAKTDIGIKMYMNGGEKGHQNGQEKKTENKDKNEHDKRMNLKIIPCTSYAHENSRRNEHYIKCTERKWP